MVFTVSYIFGKHFLYLLSKFIGYYYFDSRQFIIITTHATPTKLSLRSIPIPAGTAGKMYISPTCPSGRRLVIR